MWLCVVAVLALHASVGVTGQQCVGVDHVPVNPPKWHPGCDTIVMASQDPDIAGLWAKMHTESYFEHEWEGSMPYSAAVSYRHHNGQAYLFRMRVSSRAEHHGDHHWVIAADMFDPDWWYATPMLDTQSPVESTGWVSALSKHGLQDVNITVQCSDNVVGKVVLSNGQVVTQRVLSWSPMIFVYDNVVTPTEAETIINMSRSHSEQMNEGGGLRTNSRWGLDVSRGTASQEEYDYVENAIAKRLAWIWQVPVQNGDEMSVLGYAPCNHVTQHWDYYTKDLQPIGLFDIYWRPTSLGVHGQRMRQALVYLNDVPEEHGGATIFNRLGLAVQPKVGRALVWRNFDEFMEADRRTMHTGRPIYQGEKHVSVFTERLIGRRHYKQLGRDKRDFARARAAQAELDYQAQLADYLAKTTCSASCHAGYACHRD